MWCILIPILIGAICALLGYLLGKLLGGGNKVDLSSDLDALKSKNAKLEADLAACRSKGAKLEADLAASQSKASMSMAAAAAPAAIAFDAAAAKAVFGKTIKQDDLKIVEGIGPKIEELFHNAGIKTWSALGAATFAECKKILDDAGSRYQMHNPATWPDEAKMAAEGKFAELLKWQDELDGGK